MEKSKPVSKRRWKDKVVTKASSGGVVIKQNDTCHFAASQLSASATPINIVVGNLKKNSSVDLRSELSIDHLRIRTTVQNEILKTTSNYLQLFNTNKMPSTETYLRRARGLRNDIDPFSKESSEKNLGFLQYGNDGLETLQPFSINSLHLQNSFKTSQKLDGYKNRQNEAPKLGSSFFHKTFDEIPMRKTPDEFQPRDRDEKKGYFMRNNHLHSCWGKVKDSELIEQYCSNSSLHGLRYVGDKTLPWFERIFWVLAIICVFIGATYFIMHLYDKWVNSPIIISMSPEPASLTSFPFPSVTVCNMNNARRSKANLINKGNDNLDKLLLEDICNFQNNTIDNEVYGSADWRNVLRFMLNVSQPCERMLHFCNWHRNVTNCETIFNPILTDEGLCCNFNAVHKKYLFYNPEELTDLEISYPYETIDWKPETGYNDTPKINPNTQPWRPYGAGKYLGLTMILDANLAEYYCSSTASVGFKILLHSPIETPKIADFGLAISPGKETHIIITPRISTASWSILKLPKKKRKCYFTTERKLKYYRTYTERNCLLECEANFTQENCHCVQYYMPKSRNTPICGKKDDECARAARELMETTLYDDEENVDRLNGSKSPLCNCWPACFETNYETQISQSKLSNAFRIDEMYLNHTDQKYFTENMAIVHLYFVESQFPQLVKSELFGFIDFLSNIGGLLGLFLGFSFLSAVEILYFLTLRIWCRVTKDLGRQRNTTSVIHVRTTPKIVYPFSQ